MSMTPNRMKRAGKTPQLASTFSVFIALESLWFNLKFQHRLMIFIDFFLIYYSALDPSHNMTVLNICLCFRWYVTTYWEVIYYSTLPAVISYKKNPQIRHEARNKYRHCSNIHIYSILLGIVAHKIYTKVKQNLCLFVFLQRKLRLQTSLQVRSG